LRASSRGFANHSTARATKAEVRAEITAAAIRVDVFDPAVADDW
jgi:hypothetical protein